MERRVILPDAAKYATKNAVDYSENGGGKALIDNFTTAFGDAFDPSIHKITHVIGEGNVDDRRHEFLRSNRHRRLLILKFPNQCRIYPYAGA